MVISSLKEKFTVQPLFSLEIDMDFISIHLSLLRLNYIICDPLIRAMLGLAIHIK